MIRAKFVFMRTTKKLAVYNQLPDDEAEAGEGGILYVDKLPLKGEAGTGRGYPEYLYLTIEGG